MYAFEGNRVVRDTGSEYPIFNAPIGYFARSQLAGAVERLAGLLKPARAPNEHHGAG